MLYSECSQVSTRGCNILIRPHFPKHLWWWIIVQVRVLHRHVYKIQGIIYPAFVSYTNGTPNCVCTGRGSGGGLGTSYNMYCTTHGVKCLHLHISCHIWWWNIVQVRMLHRYVIQRIIYSAFATLDLFGVSAFDAECFSKFAQFHGPDCSMYK